MTYAYKPGVLADLFRRLAQPGAPLDVSGAPDDAAFLDDAAGGATCDRDAVALKTRDAPRTAPWCEAGYTITVATSATLELETGAECFVACLGPAPHRPLDPLAVDRDARDAHGCASIEHDLAKGAYHSERRCNCQCVVVGVTVEAVHVGWRADLLPTGAERACWTQTTHQLNAFLQQTRLQPRVYAERRGVARQDAVVGGATCDILRRAWDAAQLHGPVRTAPSGVPHVLPGGSDSTDAWRARAIPSRDVYYWMAAQRATTPTIEGRFVAFRLPYRLDRALVVLAAAPRNASFLEYLLSVTRERLARATGNPVRTERERATALRVLRLAGDIYKNQDSAMGRDPSRPATDAVATGTIARSAADSNTDKFASAWHETIDEWKTGTQPADDDDSEYARIARVVLAESATWTRGSLALLNSAAEAVVNIARDLMHAAYPVWSAPDSVAPDARDLVLRWHLAPADAAIVKLLYAEVATGAPISDSSVAARVVADSALRLERFTRASVAPGTTDTSASASRVSLRQFRPVINATVCVHVRFVNAPPRAERK